MPKGLTGEGAHWAGARSLGGFNNRCVENKVNFLKERLSLPQRTQISTERKLSTVGTGFR